MHGRSLGYVSREHGTAGFLATCGVFFGIFLCFPGVVLTAMGNSGFGDGAFEGPHSVMRTIGPILLAIGICMVVCGIFGCIYLRSRSSSGQQGFGTMLQTNQTQGIPIVTGAAPPGGGANYNVPMGQHPGPGATYPGGGYQAGYPAPGGQYPQGYQPPPQPYAPPPAASTYSQPSAPLYPPSEKSPEMAPPSYDSVVDK